MPNTALPPCPACAGENTYPDGDLLVCADCGHEWPPGAAPDDADAGDAPVRDANGTVLQDGDSVVLVKDLKVKGSSLTLKMGTKVRNIRVVGGDHDVEGKVDGSPMMLKAVYLKKV
jgi:protein PhnA